VKENLRMLGCVLAAISFTLPTSTKAQTATATMSVEVNGSNCDVSIYLARTGGTAFNLGDGSFVFSYNTSALTYSSKLTEGIWDNTTSAEYGDLFSATYVTDRSIEVVLSGSTGTDVPTGATLVGTLRFTITNPSASHNIAWNTGFSYVSTVAGVDLTALGQITFINPDNAGLPVQIASFFASLVQASGHVALNWTTVSETNNYGFEVQKAGANDATAYETIANSFVAGHGTTVEPHTYSFTDVTAAQGTWYYRLKQIDLDGTVHYSDGVRPSGVTSAGDRPLPTSYALDQNYPNPFNPSTQVRFAVEKTGKATMKVYNMLGGEVATLFDGTAEAGRYYVATFDATRLATGVYIYRLTTEERGDTRKMSLVR
jgi:hypothetical protein